MKKYLMAMVLILVPSMAMAAVQPADFAYGMPLSLKEGGAVYRLVLPLEVYQTVTQEDLGDLRVFNKAGAVVPFMLRRPRAKNEIHEKSAHLPIFPLYENEKLGGNGDLSVHIEKRKDGTILNIRTSGTAKKEGQKRVGYLIDASAHKEKIDALDIVWHSNGKSFITTVSLEYSTDLTHWSTWVHRTTLAQMNFKGHQITRKRIKLPPKKVTYIRLSWPDNGAALEVNKVVAVQRRGEEVRAHHWTELKGAPSDVSDGLAEKITAYEYDGGAQLPVNRIRMGFVEKNSILEASLLSRVDRDSQWRFRKKAIFYDLRFDDTALVQDGVSVGQTSDRYWRLEIARDALGDPQNIPTLDLGWLPHDLLFVARGQGPFMLAYGSARAGRKVSDNGAASLTQIIGNDEQNLLKEAGVLPRILLGGPELLLPAPPPLPWRKWLLWGVLVVGVALIAWMALSLGKGMAKDKT